MTSNAYQTYRDIISKITTVRVEEYNFLGLTLDIKKSTTYQTSDSNCGNIEQVKTFATSTNTNYIMHCYFVISTITL